MHILEIIFVLLIQDWFSHANTCLLPKHTTFAGSSGWSSGWDFHLGSDRRPVPLINREVCWSWFHSIETNTKLCGPIHIFKMIIRCVHDLIRTRDWGFGFHLDRLQCRGRARIGLGHGPFLHRNLHIVRAHEWPGWFLYITQCRCYRQQNHQIHHISRSWERERERERDVYIYIYTYTHYSGVTMI